MLSKDFKEFVALLNDSGVEYLVVGGCAMAFHGRPRHIGDLDISLRPTAGKTARRMNCLHQSGFGSLGLDSYDFVEENQAIHLGCSPFRNDLVTGIDGDDFDAVWPKREVVTHDGLPIDFFGLADLKANKRASGRPRDLDDLEKLP